MSVLTGVTQQWQQVGGEVCGSSMFNGKYTTVVTHF